MGKKNWVAYLVGLIFYGISIHYFEYLTLPIILGFVSYYATKQIMRTDGMSEDYWTPIEKKAFEAGEKKERARIVGIINGKFRKAFPDLAKQLVEEIEKK